MAKTNANKKEDQQTEAAQDFARHTLTGDLRDCLLDFMKHEKNPLPWNMRPESQQREVIEKITKCVQTAVEKVVNIIAADGRTTIVGKLEKLTIKDGIKAEISLGQSDPQRHSLIDSQGDVVLLVVANADAYTGEKKAALPDPDQPRLPGDEEENY